MCAAWLPHELLCAWKMGTQQHRYHNFIIFSLLRHFFFPKVFHGHCKYLLWNENFLKYAFKSTPLVPQQGGLSPLFPFLLLTAAVPHCCGWELFYPVTKLFVPNLYKMCESHAWKVLRADASTQADDQGYFLLSREKQNIEGRSSGAWAALDPGWPLLAVAALAASGGFRKVEKAEHNKRLRKGAAKVITVIFDLWISKCFLSCAWFYPSALPSLQRPPLPSWSLLSVTKMSSLGMMNIKIHPLTLQWGGVWAAPTSQPAVPPCQQIREGDTTLVYPGFLPNPDSWL